MARRLPQLFEWAAQALARTPAETGSDPVATERQKLLRAALRETLERHAVSGSWIGLDTRVRQRATPEPRLEVRLQIRHWDAGLVLGSMALQEAFKRRLQELDPSSAEWLTGVSWQFALPEGAPFPEFAPSTAKPAGKSAGKAAGNAAANDARAHRDAHDDLRRLFEASPGTHLADASYAATVPAALH
jgi:hypothetical protein